MRPGLFWSCELPNSSLSLISLLIDSELNKFNQIPGFINCAVQKSYTSNIGIGKKDLERSKSIML